MKTILLTATCIIVFATASAQTVTDYRTVPGVVALKDSITFQQKSDAAFAVAKGESAQSVRANDTHTTLIFVRYNAQVTLTNAQYRSYQFLNQKLRHRKMEREE